MSKPTTYAELQNEVLSWIEDSATNIDVAACIGYAEDRFNRVLDMPEMETIATLSTTASTALPSDFWQARSLHLEKDPRVLLEPVSLSVLRSRYAAQTTGEPEVYAIVGTNIIFGPAPDTTYSASLVYKASITPLSSTNTSNFLLTKYCDLYVVGTLMLAEMRGWNIKRAAGDLKVWWDEIMGEVVQAGIRYKRGGGPRRMRSPVRWGG
jgi:hypothetical protein